MKKLSTFLVLSFLTVTIFAQGTWHQQTQFGGASRYRAASFTVNGKCYVGTGAILGGLSNNLKDFWEYDPGTNAWTQVADLTGPKRTNGTGASDDTYGYVGLGYNAGVTLNDWWQYDPVANTWTQKTSYPSTTRYGAGSFTLNNRIYVGGGIDSINSVHSDVYAYDGASDTWTSRHALPIPVTSMATFVIGTKGYFVGGAVNGGVSGSQQTVEYDATLDTWTTKAPYAGGQIYSCIGFALDGMGYAGTGFAGNLTSMMYRFDPVANTWTQETDYPSAMRQWAVVCNVNNRAYVGTGNSTGGNLFNDWWEFVGSTTGISKYQSNLPVVVYDAASHQILVRNAKGTESIQIFTIDGKLILDGKLEIGNNQLQVQSNGVYLVRLTDKGDQRSTKLLIE